MRRVVGVLAIVVGVTLIGFTFAEHLFARSQDAQTIADQYAPLMSAKGLHNLSTGFDAVKAAGGELATSAEPKLQQALGMDDAQFEQYVAQEMPGIAKFDAQAPGVVELVGPVIGKMVAERPDYTKASDIPVSWLPLTSAPWLFLGVGLLLIGVGAYVLWRPGTLASVALLLVGLGIAIAPLVIGIPGKVDAAVRVTEIGRIGLAPATGQKAVGATALFDGMAADVHTKLSPALEQRLGAGEFAQQFPTLAEWVDSWQSSISAQSHDLSDSQVAFASTFANADKIPLEPIPWMFIIPGVVLAILAGVTLLPARRNAEAPAPAQPVTVG
jgi:uncharacterized membrane protein HdeD (DUF308 family)